MKSTKSYNQLRRLSGRVIIFASEAWLGWPTWRQIISIVSLPGAVIGCSCAVYLMCRSTGQLSSVRWIPDAIGSWADHHGQLRNVPAYFLLTCPFLPLCRNAISRVWAMVAVGAFGTMLEVAQHFIPARSVEWQDVVYTWVGAIAAWLIFEGTFRILDRFGFNTP